MIRPVTFCTMMMAALSGAYLFGVKHRAQVLDDRLAALTQAARLDDRQIAVLQAQWSMEIDHNRLQALTAKFLGLAPMKPAQLVTLAALSRVLPPPGSAAPEENPVAPVQPALEVAAETADAATPAAAPALPLPPPVAPPPGMVILASADVPQKHVVQGARQVAKTRHFVGTELAETPQMARPVEMQQPVGAKLVAVNATADDETGQGGSMLGMAADLAPPQPLAPGTSN